MNQGPGFRPLAMGTRGVMAQRKAVLLEEYRAMATTLDQADSRIIRPDPRDFVTQVLGVKPSAEALRHGMTKPWTPDQEEIMLSVRDNRKTAVAAGVGVGKTRVAAWLVLWFLYSRRPSKVITTAPTWIQVQKLLWKEIGAAWTNSVTVLPGKLLDLEIQLNDEWFALGLSTKKDVGDISATRFQGFHAPNVFVVLDEATGVIHEVWTGGEGLAIGPDDRFLAIGNPTDPASRFKSCWDLGTWKVFNLSCLDHPNVVHKNAKIVPGAVTREWVEDALVDYGSEDSPLYRSKVLGHFPEQASDALIQMGWITKAQTRWRLIQENKGFSDHRGVALGIDIAGEGEDLTACLAIENGCLNMPTLGKGKGDKYAWHVGRDVMKAVALLHMLCLKYKDQYNHTRVRSIAMDDTGLGQGVSARIRELQSEGKWPKYALNDDRKTRDVTLVPLNFGAAAFEKERFPDMKDELWWEFREELRTGTLALPPDEELAKWGLPKGGNRHHNLYRQLITPFYSINSSGLILVFDKRTSHGGGVSEEVRERVKQLPSRSPDLAHAALLVRRAWKYIRPDEAAPRPKDTEEAFVREMMDLAIKRQRGKKHKVDAYRGRNWRGR